MEIKDSHVLLQVNTAASMTKVKDATSKVLGNNAAGVNATSAADSVREALRHLWRGYHDSAWGSDEVRPISGGPGGKWGNIGIAILDTMDTLWLAGMHEEFDQGQNWVASMKLDGPANRFHTSFFEMTIRGLGGLLSSYALSERPIFLEKAKELGSHLLHAFPSKEQPDLVWPAAYMDIRKPSSIEASASWLGKSILADVGSNVLEFSYLSEASKDPRYKAAGDGNEAELLKLAETTQRHLTPKFLDPKSHRHATDDVSVGSYADSYFEYLLKGYIQSGRKNHRLLVEWKEAMEEMRKKLVRTSKGGYTFIAMDTNPRSDSMEHLSCFMGGLLALGSYYVPESERESWWLPVGAEITRTCYELYHQSPSGLAPEIATIDKTIYAEDRGYRMRPETLESLFYLYRITGNETYRDWSTEIFNAINKHARTEYGFASVRDVTRVPVRLVDSQETFVGAETFKYALLVHLPSTALPLDKFVLNTEAHPLPIIQQASPDLS